MKTGARTLVIFALLVAMLAAQCAEARHTHAYDTSSSAGTTAMTPTSVSADNDAKSSKHSSHHKHSHNSTADADMAAAPATTTPSGADEAITKKAKHKHKEMTTTIPLRSTTVTTTAVPVNTVELMEETAPPMPPKTPLKMKTLSDLSADSSPQRSGADNADMMDVDEKSEKKTKKKKKEKGDDAEASASTTTAMPSDTDVSKKPSTTESVSATNTEVGADVGASDDKSSKHHKQKSEKTKETEMIDDTVMPSNATASTKLRMSDDAPDVGQDAKSKSGANDATKKLKEGDKSVVKTSSTTVALEVNEETKPSFNSSDPDAVAAHRRLLRMKKKAKAAAEAAAANSTDTDTVNASETPHVMKVNDALNNALTKALAALHDAMASASNKTGSVDPNDEEALAEHRRILRLKKKAKMLAEAAKNATMPAAASASETPVTSMAARKSKPVATTTTSSTTTTTTTAYKTKALAFDRFNHAKMSADDVGDHLEEPPTKTVDEDDPFQLVHYPYSASTIPKKLLSALEYRCSMIRPFLEVDKVPFARDEHQAMFFGLYNKTRGVVVKAPLVNNFDSQAFIRHSKWVRQQIERLNHTMFCIDRQCMTRTTAIDFHSMIGDELELLDQLGHNELDEYVATIKGACMDGSDAPTQFVVLDGPLLPLSALHEADFLQDLSWSPRLLLGRSVVAVIQNLENAKLLHCAFGAEQIGVDYTMRARLFDLADTVRHDSANNRTLHQSDQKCRRHSECAHTCLAARDYGQSTSDAVCTRYGTCAGFDILSQLQYACRMMDWWLRPPLNTSTSSAASTRKRRHAAAPAATTTPDIFDAHHDLVHQTSSLEAGAVYTVPYADYATKLNEILDGCEDVDRRSRWTVKQVAYEMHKLVKESGAEKQWAHTKHSVVQQWSETLKNVMTQRKEWCVHSRYCQQFDADALEEEKKE